MPTSIPVRIVLLALLIATPAMSARADTVRIARDGRIVSPAVLTGRPVVAEVVAHYGPNYRIERISPGRISTLWYDSLGIGITFDSYSVTRHVEAIHLRLPSVVPLPGRARLGLPVRKVRRAYGRSIGRLWPPCRECGGARLRIGAGAVHLDDVHDSVLLGEVTVYMPAPRVKPPSWPANVDSRPCEHIHERVHRALGGPALTLEMLREIVSRADREGDELIGLPPRDRPARLGRAVPLEWGLRCTNIEFHCGMDPRSFSVLTSGDTVVAVAARSVDFTAPADSVEFLVVRDSARLASALARHSRAYGVEVGLRDLRMSPLLASWAVDPFTRYRDELSRWTVQLAEAGDTATLGRWLCSMNPYVQLFGAVGLLLAERRGAEIGDRHREQIAALRTRTEPLPWIDSFGMAATISIPADLALAAQEPAAWLARVPQQQGGR